MNVSLDDRPILHDINFELGKGENLSIIGPNGSGKTVFLKCLLGMLPYSGKIEWAKDVKIGYVPQKIDADRHLPLNLFNLLHSKARVLGLKSANIHEIIETVGITEKVLKTPIGHLSGGQFQKALIAFALLGHPNVILFDEPTASLDQLAEEHTYELMDTLREKYGITIIVVSHELSFVAEYSSKVLCLNRTQVCFGPPDEALEKDILHKTFSVTHKFHHEEHDHGVN